MTEQVLSKEDFINFILNGSDQVTKTSSVAEESALPEGFEDFGFDAAEVPTTPKDASTFASRLLEAAGFGYPELVQRESVIRSDDAVARYLPERVSYWPKTASRPYQTLLFEDALNHRKLLDIPAFKSRKINHLDIVEDALARLVSEALEGFQRGGDSVTADVRKGNKDETLCVISILDEREEESVRLVCFGTWNESTDGLETFQIREQTRFWEPQLAREHLGLVYERQFKKLVSQNWQEAFTTTDERKQAEKLLEVCTSENPTKNHIQESILALLETIAKGFGLKKRRNEPLLQTSDITEPSRLQRFALPSDHDIGISSEDLESKFAGQNPFGGVTLRDERSRLLGYIIYPLKNKADAARLRKHLEQNNRFHNVLVVYPDQEKASLELWQGKEQLTGQLRKGQGHKDAADVVNLLSRFFVVSKAKVKNPTELAQELAYRARYLRRLAVKQLNKEPDKGYLRDLYNAFKEALVHDQTEEEFADAFAQTITYGLLTARWIGNDQLVKEGERFTRQTARKYLPEANPFLKDFFDKILEANYILETNQNQRPHLLWLIEDIASLLDRIDVKYVFGAGDAGSEKATDPVIHFYEPFLADYDKDLKNKRGVFFTPRPVVSYIVRSVHELLQTEFKLADGLASTDTWGDVQKNFPDLKLPEGVKPIDPFVCILDPATGTGTFLFECIEVIERTMKDRWCRELKKNSWKDAAIIKRWKEYVPKNLLPRLYGYEIMMASYAIAHLKLSFKLGETGYNFQKIDRLNIYLTNTLEPPSKIDPKLVGSFLSLAQQAQEVNEVKYQKRFTIVIGNPPYAVNSANKNASFNSNLEMYKKGLEDERNLKPLNDDYVKFVRYAQLLIQNSIVGIVGMITNHSYADARLFRAMRKSLLESFNILKFLDLRGETSRDPRLKLAGDKNVFEIQQGVSISIFVRKNVYVSSEYVVLVQEKIGSRESKYQWLREDVDSNTIWNKAYPHPPLFSFKDEKISLKEEYDVFLSINELFQTGNVGYQTHRDAFVIDFDSSELLQRIIRFAAVDNDEKKLSEQFDITSNRDWSLSKAHNELKKDKNIEKYIKETLYRPFDFRYIFYARYLIDYDRQDLMRHIEGNNLGLLVSKVFDEHEFSSVFVTKKVVESKVADRTRGSYLFPLWILQDQDKSLLDEPTHSWKTNLNLKNLNEFSSVIGLELVFSSSELNKENQSLNYKVFYYVYALLHSISYRLRYTEFLKTGFPRIPLTSNIDLFRLLSDLGENLVSIHLMENIKLENSGYKYLGSKTSPNVEKPSYSNTTVWLDKKKTTGFADVSEDVWNFYIGGYQVCDKWLKDRKGRTLSQEDIEHYQKIVVALSETIRIMKEIDEVIDEHGGWPDAFAKGTGGNE